MKHLLFKYKKKYNGKKKETLRRYHRPFPQRLCCRNNDDIICPWLHWVSRNVLWYSIMIKLPLKHFKPVLLDSADTVPFGLLNLCIWPKKKKQEQLLFIIDRYTLDNEWYKSPGSYFENVMYLFVKEGILC